MTHSRRAPLRAILAAGACLAVLSCAGGSGSAPRAPAPPPETPHDAVVRIANDIRRAAYAGDRERLAALVEEMEPFTEGALGSRARYWRGFALWRRAWDGADAQAPEEEIEADLTRAVEELESALTLEPGFVDARVAELACLARLAPFTVPASERPKEYRRQWDLLLEAQKQAPQNPRLFWVFGMAKWDAPAKLGGGPEKAIQSYRDGLEWARKEAVADATDPAWGEGELLMSLALARLNGGSRNLDAADHYAHAALNVVPDWHYVREILLPQIQAAKAAPEPTPAPKRSKGSKGSKPAP